MTQHSFEPSQFFDVAVELAAAVSDEKHWRTAIGRAYYACFHVTRRGLERRGRWHAPVVGAHGAVLDELSRRGRWSLRDQLRSLRDLREIADYRLDVMVDAALCRDAIDRADRLLRLLASF